MLLQYHSLTNVYKGISVALFLILFISESFKLYLGYLGNLAGKVIFLLHSSSPWWKNPFYNVIVFRFQNWHAVG